MFTNILLLSLLTIVHGINGINGEDGNKGLREQFNFLDLPTQHEDMKFFKTPRAIRTPFRNTGDGINTARGFGKRNGEIEQDYANENAAEREYVNDYGTPEFQRPILFPYFQEFIKVPKYSENVVAAAPIRNHRLQLRDGTLKFRLNDGNLRTARGFGKRSYFIDADDYRINSMSSGDVLKAILNQNSQQPLKSNNNPKDNNKEEI